VELTDAQIGCVNFRAHKTLLQKDTSPLISHLHDSQRCHEDSQPAQMQCTLHGQR
jgi:hypothetical protein